MRVRTIASSMTKPEGLRFTILEDLIFLRKILRKSVRRERQVEGRCRACRERDAEELQSALHQGASVKKIRLEGPQKIFARDSRKKVY